MAGALRRGRRRRRSRLTPSWNGGPPNYYTGHSDTGARNTVGTIHDYNIGHDDWGWLGSYFDVVTPLSGRTHTDIDNSVVRLGRALKARSGSNSAPQRGNHGRQRAGGSRSTNAKTAASGSPHFFCASMRTVWPTSARRMRASPPSPSEPSSS